MMPFVSDSDDDDDELLLLFVASELVLAVRVVVVEFEFTSPEDLQPKMTIAMSRMQAMASLALIDIRFILLLCVRLSSQKSSKNHPYTAPAGRSRAENDEAGKRQRQID
jgi:hypothetical protein